MNNLIYRGTLAYQIEDIWLLLLYMFLAIWSIILTEYILDLVRGQQSLSWPWDQPIQVWRTLV